MTKKRLQLFNKKSYALVKALSVLIFIVCVSVHAKAQSTNASLTDTADNRQLITQFFETQASVKYIYGCALNAMSTAVAWSSDTSTGQAVYYKSLHDSTAVARRITAADSLMQTCNETEPQWSPDGTQIAFLSDAQTQGQLQVFIVEAATNKINSKQPLTKFNGYVSHLRWSPDGRYISVLYVENSSREPSPMAAENRFVGLIDSSVNRNVQRIAAIDIETAKTSIITPGQLYIFEYDWSPDSKKFAYTAAPPPGDDNWYVARLYTQSISGRDSVLIYQPQKQIAVPRWRPDGKQIAFIEGLMSDQGGTGGEVFTIAAQPNSKPQNLTPHRLSTPSWFTWQSNENILFTEFVGGSVAMSSLNTKTSVSKKLWQEDMSIRAGNEETSLSVAINQAPATFAFIKSAWNNLPEIYYGNERQQKQITHLNANIQKPLLKTADIKWKNEGKNVQGWLLFPANYDSTRLYPMLVCVHGGPAWISTPTWSAPDFNTTVYTQLGYFVFFPNARGSYGQGEEFTLANRKDWGFGDMRDILSGMDIIIKKYAVDSSRIGVLGWSYGGAMAMMSVTQTNRFKAAVAGAGACDWKSYYGQNSIDKWMMDYFEASPYSDPKTYEKVSAITYIKNAKTPTLVLVGERDGEAPPPQSFQFWHALKELKVPTQLFVYADEGHAFERFEDMIDVSVRTIEWFNENMKVNK